MPSSMGYRGSSRALTVVLLPPTYPFFSKIVMLTLCPMSPTSLARWYAVDAPPAPAPMRQSSNGVVGQDR
jgi:hypothetical protein